MPGLLSKYLAQRVVDNGAQRRAPLSRATPRLAEEFVVEDESGSHTGESTHPNGVPQCRREGPAEGRSIGPCLALTVFAHFRPRSESARSSTSGPTGSIFHIRF